MTNTVVSIGLVCLIFAAIMLTFWLSRRPLLLELAATQKDAAALLADLTQTLRDLNDSRAEFERQARQVVAIELLEAQFLATDWERRAIEYRNQIEGVIKERNMWNTFYDEQSIAHGNAQALMMDSIGYLERELKKKGSSVILPDIVRETQALYRDRHVEPVLERTGAARVTPRESQGQTMSAQDQK